MELNKHWNQRKAITQEIEKTKDLMEDIRIEVRENSGGVLSLQNIYDSASTERDLGSKISLYRMALQKIQMMERSLHALNGNSYGNCCHCGDAIEERRLEALPSATSCVPCQELLDKKSRERKQRFVSIPGLQFFPLRSLAI